MKFERRDFLKSAGLITAAGFIPGLISCDSSVEQEDQQERALSETERQQRDDNVGSQRNDISSKFELDHEYVHMAGLLLASHPEPVSRAISTHRGKLNENPAQYVQEKFNDLPAQVRESAANYMGVLTDEIALTDSTTMGTALLINGLHIRGDQEMLSAEYDYSVTHRSVEYKSKRSGASFRRVPIYEDIHSVSEEEIVERLIEAVAPNTRLVTGTWVHSSTGLKIPVRKISDRLAEINASRNPENRVLFYVDGVHGFGVEDTAISDLGCDFFSAGTHKWMFAPRGTGILWGRREAHEHVSPTIPTFTDEAGWGGRMTPGGFKAYEHQWAMAQAFDFHLEVGKRQVQNSIHSLALQLKEGLKDMDHVTLYTPMEQKLSSGIVCFDIDGMSPYSVVDRLAEKNIIASTTPYDVTYARFTPGIYNSREDIEKVLQAVRDLV